MKKGNNESGFSYIDVMIGITILLVGVLGLVAAITRGITMTTVSQEMLSAKQQAASTMENIYTAREINPDTLIWDRIRNASTGNPGGLFVTGEQLIYPTAGRDGIIGTADDPNGLDGIANNADDGTPMDGFTREITIENVVDARRPNAPISLRKIDVTIRYWISGRRRTETFTSYIANYRTEDTLDTVN